MHIYSFSPFGYEGALVSVEVDLRKGIPAVDMVGLADGAVKESRERIRSAIRNSGLEFPMERVLISLSPADLKKEGAGFDLAIALAVLDAKFRLERGELPLDTEEEKILVIGELDLSGNVRNVRGIQAAISTAAAGGITRCIVPAGNAGEARKVKGSSVFSAATLLDAVNALQTGQGFEEGAAEEETFGDGFSEIDGVVFPDAETDGDISAVRGQPRLIRALQIAAAGAHNVLAYGTPGCGKTLALQRFASLVPVLTEEESQIVTRIHSLAGLLPSGAASVRIAPFRMPHQTASIEGICGGGPRCSPGEISLAHGGALFLDEASQFKSSVLQMLRVPLESGCITLSRAGRSTVYPARFQLLIATNPCPCGNLGSEDKLCLCSAHSIEQFWKKFSAPLLDRIDLRVHVDLPDMSAENPVLNDLRREIARAVLAQRKRQGKRNALLSPQEVLQFCSAESGMMEESAKKLIDDAQERFGMSQRAANGCVKLARTIADMDGKEIIAEKHAAEAISYRKTEVGLGGISEML